METRHGRKAGRGSQPANSCQELSEENQKLKDDLAKIKNNLPEEYRKLKFKLNYQ